MSLACSTIWEARARTEGTPSLSPRGLHQGEVDVVHMPIEHGADAIHEDTYWDFVGRTAVFGISCVSRTVHLGNFLLSFFGIQALDR